MAFGTTAKLLAALLLVAAALFLLLTLFQRKLIYLPTRGAVAPAAGLFSSGQDVEITTDDGLNLGAYWIPPRDDRRPVILFLNGNAGNREGRASFARAVAARGFGVLLWDYRGYADNPGSPTEAHLIADARAVRRFLDGQVDASRVVYFGESLGAAVAVALATTDPPRALILRSPFFSTFDVARVHYPFIPARWLLRDGWRSDLRIARIDCPLLVLAGDADGIVPPEQSRRLFEAAGAARKEWLAFPGVGHNDVAFADGSRMIDAVVEFVE